MAHVMWRGGGLRNCRVMLYEKGKIPGTIYASGWENSIAYSFGMM